MVRSLNYTTYDYDTLVTQLQNRLKSVGTWKDTYQSGTGLMMIQLFAAIGELILYYTERRAQESYITTARNRSSIVNLVQLLNYSPKRVTSSTGVLTFSISGTLTKIVYIPKYTECESVDGVKFLTNETAAIEKGQTSVDVNCIQGELVQIEITSDGSTSQEYSVNDTSVENSADTDNPSFRVIVDGEEWTAVDSFINSDADDKHYRILNNMNSTVTVIFGDNVNGVAPSSGDTVVIQYIKSDGLDGNVTNADKITTLNSTIYDEDGTIVTTTVTNDDSFLGGDSEESAEEIRFEAPRVFSTGDRAVSKADFIAILENYSGVASANAWGENEEAEAAGTEVDYEMLNKVKICLVLQEWETADDTFKSNLSDYIYNISMLTVKYEFVAPTILYTIPVLTVVVTEGYSLSGAQADIEEVLENAFDLGATTKLGTLIKHSNILSDLDDLDSVAYISMDLEIRKELSDSYDSSADWGAALDATDIKAETARLFIGDTEICTDSDNGDGTGAFTASGDYTVSGTINYSTGVVLLDISPTPSATPVIRYQQDEDNNIVPSFTQIAKLYDVDIDSISTED